MPAARRGIARYAALGADRMETARLKQQGLYKIAVNVIFSSTIS
jgi:hypothetical protein